MGFKPIAMFKIQASSAAPRQQNSFGESGQNDGGLAGGKSIGNFCRSWG
jgi:hypothetical protein